MRRKKLICNQSGLTLVELVIALAFISVVLALGQLLFSFGQHGFTRGEQRTNVQREMRLGADYILKELRFADSIKLNPPSKTSSYNYIYLNAGGSVVHRDQAGNETVIVNGTQDGVSYDLQFLKEGDRLLSFTISSAQEDFSLENKLVILNLNDVIDSTHGSSGSSIQYSLPEE